MPDTGLPPGSPCQAPSLLWSPPALKQATRAFRLAGDRIAIGARGSLGASSNTGEGERLKHAIDATGDLGGHALLDLEPLCIDVHEPREFRDPDHPCMREIADMRAADDGSQMMLAVGLEADVAKQHDLIIVCDLLERALQIIARILVVTGEPLLVGAHGPCGRAA